MSGVTLKFISNMKYQIITENFVLYFGTLYEQSIYFLITLFFMRNVIAQLYPTSSTECLKIIFYNTIPF